MLFIINSLVLLFFPGVLEGELLQPDINAILIERYGESIVYRSRNCTRIIEDLLASGKKCYSIDRCLYDFGENECVSFRLI